jgi:tetratricopeptide (TPR) repeat protein
LEEARDAYEAQPFIDEHLEIARQLFVQERLDEATAEIQKILFLSANHGEAKKLEAKIEALKLKLSPPEQPSAPSAAVTSASDTQQVRVPPDFGDSLELPQESPETPEPAAASDPADSRPADPAAVTHEEPVLNEDWEAELAQLNLESSESPAQPTEAALVNEPEPMLLTDLSESSTRSPSPSTPPEEFASVTKKRQAEQRGALPELDLDNLGTSLSEDASVRGEGRLRPTRSEERSAERATRVRPAPAAREGFSFGKLLLVLLFFLTLAGGGWWMFGQRSANASGQGGSQGAPPVGRIPAQRRAPIAGPAATPSNVGLSSTSSRPTSTASAQSAGPDLPGASAAPAEPLSPEEAQREIAGLFADGKTQMKRNAYEEAVATFSKILDLDPANLEAKEHFDEAASKVQEQKKLEEDLQTGKQLFVDKDYESALRKFYRLPKDRNLGDVDLFIRNAWFNWAVVSMKGGNCVEALTRLEENLTLHPDDQDAVKLREVAEHYRDRPKDKVFYAYVDRLTYRTLNQK